jgi:hypothetical protein
MKVVLSSLSEVPDALRTEYEERDGKFYLKVEGDPQGFVKSSELADANAKLVEFRDSNRSLKAIVAKFEGIDPDEHKMLKEKIAELEKQGVKGGEDINAIVQKALENAVTPLQSKLEEIQEREKKATAALARKDLESMLTQAGLNAGIGEKAIPDYLRRGLETFTLEDGKAVARNGDTPLYSKAKPTVPLSIGEWAAELSSEAPHLFKPSKGGGASPGPGGDGSRSTYDPNSDADFLSNVDKIAKGEMTARETP